jgi:hypothetical protein
LGLSGNEKQSRDNGDRMSALVGNPEVGTIALQTMRERATPSDKWWAFQNHDLGSSGLGDLQFLQIGPGRTFTKPPERMPDTQHSIGWRYVLVGVVNLETGQIE